MDLGLYYCTTCSSAILLGKLLQTGGWDSSTSASCHYATRPSIRQYSPQGFCPREVEALYYQRKASRIHFIRHSIHLLTPLSPLRPPAPVHWPVTHSGQWKQLSGTWGKEIRQRQRPLIATLKRGVLRAQLPTPSWRCIQILTSQPWHT